MKIAAALVGLFTIVVGVLGIVTPDSVTTARRMYFATPVGLYGAAAVRVAMGLVVILCARASRAPKALRALGALMCLQVLTPTLWPDRARAILEWESMHPALLRAGAVVAVVAGGFIVFAVTTSRPREFRIR